MLRRVTIGNAGLTSQSKGSSLSLKELLELNDQINDLHYRFLEAVTELRSTLKKNESSLPELTDFGVSLRQSEMKLEEWRKETTAIRDFVGKLLCMKWVQEEALSSDPEVFVRGSIGRATPDIKTLTILPSKGTPEFDELCKWLGLTPQQVDAGLVKPDWKAVQDLFTAYAEDGKPVPSCAGKTVPQYVCVFQRNSKST